VEEVPWRRHEPVDIRELLLHARGGVLQVVGRKDQPERRKRVFLVRQLVPETLERLRAALEIGPRLVEAGEETPGQAREM
jgi:hypothetical protein